MKLTPMFLRHTRALLGFTLLWITSGCSGIPIHGDHGETHHIILGFGVVTVQDQKENALVATESTSFGLALSDRPNFKMDLGYASNTVVTVDKGAEDVRAEVSQKPGGPIIVDVPSAISHQQNLLEKGE